MRRNLQFFVRISPDERQMIKNLAKRLQRSQSDAVRFVIRAAVNELKNMDIQELNKKIPAGQGGEKTIPTVNKESSS